MKDMQNRTQKYVCTRPLTDEELSSDAFKFLKALELDNVHRGMWFEAIEKKSDTVDLKIMPLSYPYEGSRKQKSEEYWPQKNAVTIYEIRLYGKETVSLHSNPLRIDFKEIRTQSAQSDTELWLIPFADKIELFDGTVLNFNGMMDEDRAAFTLNICMPMLKLRNEAQAAVHTQKMDYILKAIHSLLEFSKKEISIKDENEQFADYMFKIAADVCTRNERIELERKSKLQSVCNAQGYMHDAWAEIRRN